MRSCLPEANEQKEGRGKFESVKRDCRISNSCRAFCNKLLADEETIEPRSGELSTALDSPVKRKDQESKEQKGRGLKIGAEEPKAEPRESFSVKSEVRRGTKVPGG